MNQRSHLLCMAAAVALLIIASPMNSTAEGNGWQGPITESFSEENIPRISARSFALIDLQSGMLLLGKDIDSIRHPASLTKIMTLLLAQELGRSDELVQVSSKAAYTPGSSMGVRTGETWRLGDLMLGVALESGNDAAIAVAQHLGGSVKEFARLMNERAAQMGMNSTSYSNPHGLTEDDHLTSAKDLSLLAGHFMKNPVLRHLVSLKEASVQSLGGRQIPLRNTNRLLHSDILYKGVKTGTTRAAGRCLVASARRGSRQLVAVIVKSGDRWGDARRMLAWGYERFTWRTVATPVLPMASIAISGSPQQDSMGLYPRKTVVLPVPDEIHPEQLQLIINRPATASPGAHGPLGEVVVRFSGHTIYRTELYLHSSNW